MSSRLAPMSAFWSRVDTRGLPWAAAAIAILSLSLPAAAQDAKSLQTASLAATCANCHGTAGKAVSGSTVPGLAGRPAEYIVERMKSYKDGSRQASVMHQIAKGYSEAQIQQLAGYFAAQPR